jgi:hypothetical protein
MLARTYINDRLACLKVLNSLLAAGLRSRYLDDITRIDVTQLVGVNHLADGVVRARAGELHLRVRALLELVEVLASATDERAVVIARNLNTDNDAVAELRRFLLELGLELRNELGLTAQVNLVGEVALARATALSVTARACMEVARTIAQARREAWGRRAHRHAR